MDNDVLPAEHEAARRCEHPRAPHHAAHEAMVRAAARAAAQAAKRAAAFRELSLLYYDGKNSPNEFMGNTKLTPIPTSGGGRWWVFTDPDFGFFQGNSFRHMH